MKLYRINKVDKLGGRAIKKTDVLATSDADAMRRAEESADCPTCEVLRDGQPVGTII